MLRALLFCLALSLALAPGASAEVRLIDTTTGASRTILHDDPREPYTETEEPQLIRFADAETVLVRRRGRVLAIRIADGNRRRLPWLDKAEAIGPGGRSIHLDYGETDPYVTLRRPDGSTVGRYDFGASYDQPSVAWTPDGGRVAIARAPWLRVIDTHTGAITSERRIRADGLFEFTSSAWAPDGAALLITDGARLQRLDLASGTVTSLFLAPDEELTPSGYWSESGRIVVNDGWKVRLLDDLAFRIDAGGKRLSAAWWSLNGSALMWTYSGRLDDCYFPNEGVATQVPGQPPRVLVRPGQRKMVRYHETLDARYLAVDLEPGEDREPERRGKRRPWPKRIHRDYDVGNRRGNAAVRRVVERAAWRLRHGVSRHVTLIHVRNEFGAIDAPGIDSGAPEEALADTIDQWLIAAGFGGIDARDEVVCS